MDGNITQKIVFCPYAIHPPASMVSWWVLVHFGLHFASIFWKQPNKLVDLVGWGGSFWLVHEMLKNVTKKVKVYTSVRQVFEFIIIVGYGF
jgi:hypothetical protein